MKKSTVDYSLCLVTDRGLMSTATLEEAVAQSISGGVTIVQLREKDTSSAEMYGLAGRLKEICDQNNVPLIIDDRVDIALAVGASGVHIGQNDLPANVVRRIIGSDKIMGVSATNVHEALQAQEDGADYIGVGAMIPTGSKTDAKIVSIDELSAIRAAVTIPIMIIGGLNCDNLLRFAGMGVNAIAVISAIIAQEDIRTAASEMKKIIRSVYGL